MKRIAANYLHFFGVHGCLPFDKCSISIMTPRYEQPQEPLYQTPDSITPSHACFGRFLALKQGLTLKDELRPISFQVKSAFFEATPQRSILHTTPEFLGHSIGTLMVDSQQNSARTSYWEKVCCPSKS